MKKIFLLFARYVKDEVDIMNDDKYFILDCMKFNFKFLDSLDKCVKCNWANKLIIPTSDIKNWEAEYLAEHIESTVYMYQKQRVIELIKKLYK